VIGEEGFFLLLRIGRYGIFYKALLKTLNRAAWNVSIHKYDGTKVWIINMMVPKKG
jgi:hypothetical protein